MVREARFSWDDARDEGAGPNRPDIEGWDDDDDCDFDDLDPRPPRRKPGSRSDSTTGIDNRRE